MFCAADVHAGAHQAARDALHRRAGMSHTQSSLIKTTLLKWNESNLQILNSSLFIPIKRKENERIFIDSSTLMIDGLNFKIDIF